MPCIRFTGTLLLVLKQKKLAFAFLLCVSTLASCAASNGTPSKLSKTTHQVASSSTVPPTTSTTPTPETLSDPSGVGKAWGSAVPGVLTFKGNPTRSYDGPGPSPVKPSISWRYPSQRMCGVSSEYGKPRTWCGTGWVGHPAVFERLGRTWVVFGAYDYKIHFVDGLTGKDIIPPFPTSDIAKGSVTVDPDGYPIVYQGSRDNFLRAIAFDGPSPRELWRFDGRVANRRWNNDWDAAPLILHDTLLTGGENSWFFGFDLNRSYGPDGLVHLDVSERFRTPGFDSRLLSDLKDNRVSFESSVAVFGNTAYLVNSGGLVQGWDLTPLLTSKKKFTPVRTFRFWTGDDADASIVIDEEGFLYVGVEVDRNTPRAKKVGQFLKLDPSAPSRGEDPVVWSMDVNNGVDSGTWSTPSLYKNLVIWATKPGKVYAIDRLSGSVLWDLHVSGPVLSSPIVVKDTLLLSDGSGAVRAWSLTTPKPTLLWKVSLGANVESTPSVWKGRVYVGSRTGFFYSLAD